MATISKIKYAAAVRIYIQHKRVLEQYSAWYKQAAVANSMSKVYDLFKFVKRDCNEFSSKQLASMVLIYQNDLVQILPAPKNPAFETQKNKVEKLIEIAKQIIN